jgi:DNA-binding CsgD family transcriptional regulator
VVPGAPRERLAIQSPDRLVREVLAAYFAGEHAFRVVGKPATLDRLRLLCELSRPHAALVELTSVTPASVAELAGIAHAFVDMALVLWYTEVDEARLQTVNDAGLPAPIPAGRGLPALLGALRRHPAASTSPASISPAGPNDRELTVLSLLGSGMTVAEIADRLAISPYTVDNDKRRIYTKLGVGHQCQAVSLAVRLGLVEQDLHGATPVDLSSREREILGSIADGHTVRETAQRLGVAVKTVENLQARLFSKLGTHNRSQTLTVAYRLGLVDAPQ